MQGQVFKRGAPRNKVEDDGGNAGKGKDEKGNGLGALATIAQDEIEAYVDADTYEDADDMDDAKGTPNHKAVSVLPRMALNYFLLYTSILRYILVC